MGLKVLLLNADYSALSIVSVPKAFLLVYANKAVMVTKDEKREIRTVTTSYPLPSVIKLNRYISIPYRTVVMNRSNILKRDGNSCVYCRSAKDLTLDHVIPKSRGGKTSWSNLVAACKRCNSKKGNNTPEEAEMKMTHRPFKPTFLTFIRDFSGNDEKHWIPFLGIR